MGGCCAQQVPPRGRSACLYPWVQSRGRSACLYLVVVVVIVVVGGVVAAAVVAGTTAIKDLCVCLIRFECVLKQKVHLAYTRCPFVINVCFA